MSVKDEYIHQVVYRTTNEQTGHERQLVLKGTSEQIGERVAETIKMELDRSGSRVIRLEPLAPHNIFDLARN